MADIVIRGMEMPKTCCQCDLKIYDPEKRWNENGIEQIGAWVCKRTGEVIWNTQRGEDCPLVPLPEGHGRLVDEDEIKTRMTRKMYACRHNSVGELTYAVCIDIVDHADTILEAEGGGEDG